MGDLTIAHLYPDLLRTYGDRGNILTLRRRAEWREIDVDVVSVARGEPVPDRCRLVFVGGGSDRVQRAVANDLLARKDEIAGLVSAGSAVLGVCGGYQLLGKAYRTTTGTVIEGLGLIDAVTESGDGRIVGRVRGSIRRPDLTTRLIGFENHAGRTWVGPGATPLARVARGRGNNGSDRTEGAVQGRVVGTYLHGPVLALNPAFADWLLALALGRERVDPLNDEAERHARAAWPRGRKR